MIRRLNEPGFHTQRYVDDLVIVVTEGHKGTSVEVVQNSLNIIEDWFNDLDLSINPDKTESLVLTRRRNLPDLANTNFYCKKVVVSTSD